MTTPAVGSGGNVTIDTSSPRSGTAATFTLVVLVDSGFTDTVVSNTATGTTTTTDTNPNNITATTSAPVSRIPTITSDQPAVTVGEGATATNTGRFDGPDGRGTVTLTASVGAVTQNNTTGTWAWSFTPADGPAGPTTVTITATDITGLTATTTFTLTVANVAPSITISGPPAVTVGAVYTLTLGPVADPGADTVTQHIVNWGTGQPTFT